ncbi:hypothetical protein ACKRZS_004172 [Fusarium odoratissimum]
MTSERAIRFGYLGDRSIDLSDLRKRCYEEVQAAFMAADSAYEDPAELGDNTALDEPGLNLEETLALEGRAEAQGEPDKASLLLLQALTMAARVLEASTATEMAQRVCSGVDLDDLILNIESLKPPTQSEPWESDMPDKPGYHHVYAPLGCLMATTYVNQCFVIETLYLDRAISNLDIAVLKMPNTLFKDFRKFLRNIRKDVHRLQVFFHRIEMEDDPAIDSALCAICIELKPIIGFHDTEFPYHKMDFTWVCKKAALRCRICTLFRDSTASMYPLFNMSWPDIREITYSNRSVGRRWFGESEDYLADVFPDDRGRYIALSHCWGDAMPLKTTKASFAEFCHSIHFAQFPKTFQEAIIVCRKLNIEYLWIDSLCIIQDDEHDWAVESPKMCDVYQNAYLAIAAAAAHNSSEGLFHQRPFSLRKSCTTASKNDDKVEEAEIFARPWSSQRHWIDSIGDGPWCRDLNPLEKRAWTLQSTCYPVESSVSPLTS